VHRLVEEDTGGGLGDEAGPRQRPPKKNGQSPRDRAREVIQKQLARLPTRRELAGTALGIIFATMMLTTRSCWSFCASGI
jgi:hypothetical protein